MLPRWPAIAATLLGLAGLHGVIALLPGLLPPATNLVLFAANLYVAYCVWLVMRDLGSREVGLFAVGYMLLFVMIVLLLGRESLFVLLILLYASVFRVPLLLGVFVAFVLSYVAFQPYAFETFVPLALGWVILWRVRRSGASWFLQACLAGGLLALACLLLPLFHLLAADAPQTLWYVLSRSDVRSAICLSLASSALATLIVAVWGIPLAYALARTRFRGRGVVEALIDLPILIPQSVVGIALLTVLGPGSPLGEFLEGSGLGVSGRLAGIVIAQVFVAFPFLVKTAVTAFEGVPGHLEDVSRTLGASPARTFFQVALPLASRGIFTGLILCWARAVSEFGALMLFAADPRTAPVLAHTEFLQAGLSQARPIAAVLLLVCLWVFVLLQFGRTFLPSAFANRRTRA